VLELARRHAVQQLVWEAVTRGDIGLVPSDVRALVAQRGEAVRARNLASVGQLLEVIRVLAESAIAAVPYKGPVLAQVAYGDLALRWFGDLDVLIESSSVPEALERLGAAGFAPITPITSRQLHHLIRVGHDIALKGDPLPVELQWAVGSRAHVVPRGVGGLIQGSSPVEIAGRTIPSLSPNDQVLVLAVHGSIHLWSRLAWVSDFIASTRVDGVDLPASLRVAENIRCRKMLLLAAAVAESVLAVRVDDELCEMATRDADVRGLAARVRTALLAPDGPDLGRAPSRVLSRVHLADSRRVGIEGALRSLLTPTEADWSRLSLPDSAFALYYPFRLARAAGFALGLGREGGHDIFDVP
jgi:putative nucleotidyltransferase-like protein